MRDLTAVQTLGFLVGFAVVVAVAADRAWTRPWRTRARRAERRVSVLTARLAELEGRSAFDPAVVVRAQDRARALHPSTTPAPPHQHLPARQLRIIEGDHGA